jgi:hypothetical protein
MLLCRLTCEKCSLIDTQQDAYHKSNVFICLRMTTARQKKQAVLSHKPDRIVALFLTAL